MSQSATFHGKETVGVEDKTDMSEDYIKFDEIPPFAVNTDPSILLDNEDAPWLRRNHKQGTHKKKYCTPTLDGDVGDV
jgi:hypothetical protein